MTQYGRYTSWVSSRARIGAEANDGRPSENLFKVSLWNKHSGSPLMLLLYLPQRPQVQAGGRSKLVRVKFNCDIPATPQSLYKVHITRLPNLLNGPRLTMCSRGL